MKDCLLDLMLWDKLSNKVSVLTRYFFIET